LKEKARAYLMHKGIEVRGLGDHSLDGVEKVDAIDAHYHREKNS